MIAPLHTTEVYKIAGLTGRYFHHFINHFLAHKKTSVDHDTKEAIYKNLQIWLPAEDVVSLVPVKKIEITMREGDVYWKYGNVEKGYWCSDPDQPESCTPLIAQYGKWRSIY